MKDSLQFLCPNCGKNLALAQGQSGKCPRCGVAVRASLPHSEDEPSGATPTLYPLSLVTILTSAVLTLAVFVAWLYGHEAVKTEKRLEAALTPREREELAQEAARLEGQIANLKKQIESGRSAIAKAESEVAKGDTVLKDLERRKGEMEEARANFVEFLRKVELKPPAVGMEGS